MCAVPAHVALSDAWSTPIISGYHSVCLSMWTSAPAKPPLTLPSISGQKGSDKACKQW